MCRALTYFGSSILLDDLLYQPDNSLIKQSYQAKLMDTIQNLAGFGMALWSEKSFNPKVPYLYHTPYLPFMDVNLKHFAVKTKLECLVAHVRGVGYKETEVVHQKNVHPFLFPGHVLALAHNGQLDSFLQMRFELLPYIKPHIARYIAGTTDSEWIYALLLSFIPHPEEENDPRSVEKALLKTFLTIQKVRKKLKICVASPVNLFISNGTFLIATRFVFDFGRAPEHYDRTHLAFHSLWYTYGKKYGKYEEEYRMSEGDKKQSVIISSEPLTADMTTWIEVPEYSMIFAEKQKNEISIRISDLSI